MAEKPSEVAEDCVESVADSQDEFLSIKVNSKETSKRCSSSSPTAAPPDKAPCSGLPSPGPHTPDTVEEPSETDKQDVQIESADGPQSPAVSPTARRKSWRRATLTRRSLPGLPNQHQILCRTISTSLSQQERLEKLMEASMRLAIEKIQNSLESLPKASLESFNQQVQLMHKDWAFLAESIRGEPENHQPLASTVRLSDPSVQIAMEKLRKAINRLKEESKSWESLLNKHRNKAEELKRKVEQGQETGIPLDSASVAQSSQYHLIQSKPDYHGLLCRQQPILHTMAMIMDAQRKMVKQLLVIKDQSQLFVKETSGRLAAEAGFEDLPPDPLRKLMAAPSFTT
ncbi:kinetochore-associated protein DSN1 homolog [Antennarius striatus]|uniref:kinetochore-associated protein DSN1 homolog n=1 Tax=Antennarius striatus TaxID=241820 RepID=UPI0035AFAEB8